TITDVSNIEKYITGGKKYLLSFPDNDFLESTAFIRSWALNKPTNTLTKSPASYAIDVLQGSTTALATLQQKKVVSASDRFIWDGENPYDAVLPALAMVEKGSLADSQKAIKGLAMGVRDAYTPSPLALLASIKDAIKHRYSFQKPTYRLTVNGQKIQEVDTQQYFYFPINTYASKDMESGKVTAEIKTKGDIPLYTMVTTTEYKDSSSKTGQSFPFNLSLQSEGAKVLPTKVQRILLNPQTREQIKQPKEGEVSVVSLSFDFSFPTSIETGLVSLYTVSGFDGISPQYMVFDQTSGNSGQYQSVLSRLFPSPKQYDRTYIPMADFTDQAVFFNNSVTTPEKTISLPYVVYAISDGEYYQPKTSFVFPYLGIIISEQ
ncbi:MAG: hypothetical protein ACD_19C00040G0001, partial [uncultured bacterium]